jgi:hypothetical protein
MRLRMMALALSTLCLISCADRPGRGIPIAPDPARLASCPTEYPAPPKLAPMVPFDLPDGRVVVLLGTVIEREQVTARYIIEGRGAWHECRSAVAFVQDSIGRQERGN